MTPVILLFTALCGLFFPRITLTVFVGAMFGWPYGLGFAVFVALWAVLIGMFYRTDDNF